MFISGNHYKGKIRMILLIHIHVVLLTTMYIPEFEYQFNKERVILKKYNNMKSFNGIYHHQVACVKRKKVSTKFHE